MNDQHPASDAAATPSSSSPFRSHVERLVAEGKLTPEEGAALLEDLTPEDSLSDAGPETPHATSLAAWADVPPDLDLRVSGYTLTVVVDSGLSGPVLNANREGELLLESSAHGWTVRRLRRTPGEGWSSGLNAVLSVPSAPRNVHGHISGGNLTLPDLGGAMRAEVGGGTLRMGRAAGLHAEVNGGTLTATEMGGPTHLNVNGGNLTLTGAHTLNASINGGNLRWAGVLAGGDHRVEVNGGNATLSLKPGSSVRVRADVTAGNFRADFPTQKHGAFLNTRHEGQLGAGVAGLACRVTAGQIKLISTEGGEWA